MRSILADFKSAALRMKWPLNRRHQRLAGSLPRRFARMKYKHNGKKHLAVRLEGVAAMGNSPAGNGNAPA